MEAVIAVALICAQWLYDNIGFLIAMVFAVYFVVSFETIKDAIVGAASDLSELREDARRTRLATEEMVSALHRIERRPVDDGA